MAGICQVMGSNSYISVTCTCDNFLQNRKFYSEADSESISDNLKICLGGGRGQYEKTERKDSKVLDMCGNVMHGSVR